jgi:hypothetical protein
MARGGRAYHGSELEKLNNAVTGLLQGVLGPVGGLVGDLLGSIVGKSITMRDTYISDTKGQVNVANLDSVIAQIQRSGGADIAKLIEAIRRQVLASSALGPEEQQEALDNLATVGNEAIKPKPNRSVMRAAVQRIREVVGSAADISGTIQLVQILSQAISLWGTRS